MSFVDRKIDPTTGDYSVDGKGRFTKCDPVENKVAFLLTVPLASWEGDPTVGHRLDELHDKNSAATRIIAKGFIELALRPLIDSGEILDAVGIVESLDDDGIAYAAVITKPDGTTVRQTFFRSLGGG